MNPYSEGKLHKIGLDLFVKGFGPDRLVRAYMALTNTRETDRLILECATLTEMDDEYNDGEFLEEGLYEAVTVKRFSQTDSRMRALARVFAKHLPEGIAPAEAIIGKPKKSGLFANVTAQIPFSDGQAITIVFHSPSGDAKKIGPDDEIVAYRWLLNKRDITLVVSPEGEGEVSLEEVGKRIAQLVAKNSARFQATQKDVKAQNDQLVTLKAEADNLSTENVALMNGLRDQQSAAEITQTKITMTQGLLEKQREINSDLENQLAALQVKAKADEAARAMAVETAAKQAADEAAAAVVPEVTPVIPEVVPVVPAVKSKASGPAWKLPIEDVKAMDEKRYQKALNALANKNSHSQSAILIAKRLGTPQDVTEAETILSEHIAAGELTDELYERRTTLLARLSKWERPNPTFKAVDPEPVTPEPPEVPAALPPAIDWNDRSDEERDRLKNVGLNVLPDINPLFAEDAGELWERLQRGDATQEQWDRYVKAAVTTPDAVTVANNIISGKYDSLPLGDVLKLAGPVMDLDEAMYANLMDQVDAYTTVLTKKAVQAKFAE
jgi:lysophospholipase L1-like esterase